MITLDNLHVWFHKGSVNERHALDDISIDIKARDFIVVLGNNGAGKSTLLNVLAGDIKPSSGKVLIDDACLHDMDKTDRALFVARVHQHPHLGSWGEMTIEENLSLAFLRGRFRGLHYGTPASRRHMFKERIALLGLGLEDKLHVSMESLSGGQRQAVNLVMATLAPLKLLLLDEHTSALDPAMAKLVMKLTQKLVAELELTVLMITHRLHDATDVGNRCVFLQSGKLLKDIQEKQKSSLTHSEVMNWLEDEA